MQERTSFAVASDGFVKSLCAVFSTWRMLLMCYGSILQLFFLSFIGALCTIPLSDIFSGRIALILYTVVIALLAYYLVTIAIGSAMAVFVQHARGNSAGIRETRARMNGIILRLAFVDQSGALQLAALGLLSFSGYLAPNIFALFHGYGMAKGGLSLSDPLWIVFAILAVVAGPYCSGLTALSLRNIMLLEVDAQRAIRQAREELRIYSETYNVVMLYLVCIGLVYFIANQHFILHYIIPSEENLEARRGIFLPVMFSSFLAMIGILLQALPYAWISEELSSGVVEVVPDEIEAAAVPKPATSVYRASKNILLVVFAPILIGCAAAALAFVLPHLIHRRAPAAAAPPLRALADARAITIIERSAGLDLLPLDYKAVSASKNSLLIAHAKSESHFPLRIAIEPATKALRVAAHLKILPRTFLPHGCLEVGGETLKLHKQKLRIHKLACVDAQGVPSVRGIALIVRGKHIVDVRGTGEFGSYDGRAIAHVATFAAKPGHTGAHADAAIPGPKVTVLTAAALTPPEVPLWLRLTAPFKQFRRSFTHRDLDVTMRNVSPESCTDTAVHAPSGGKPVTVSVMNATTVPIDVVQVNANGERSDYAHIPASGSLVISSFAAQPWFFRHDGTCTAALRARNVPGSISFD